MIRKVHAGSFVVTRWIGIMLGCTLGAVGAVSHTDWLSGAGLGMILFAVVDFIAFWEGPEE